ncbi:hypothetical protein [Kineococcus sp. SYSU DK003]|uniref:hypothetical protein n=1 Tax=Kineococcus sp. SYSU DK003 TaxID=3383124 RepID=UPI003D7C54E2
MPRINTRRALTVGLTSLASLTLLPLLAEARPTERTILLIAAIPAATLFGYLAGYAAAPTGGDLTGHQAPATARSQPLATGTRPTPPRPPRSVGSLQDAGTPPPLRLIHGAVRDRPGTRAG